MSAIPAWKRALLEKKKQQEQQEEIKKKQEQEAYIKSLPAWKRAIIMRDMEKNKSASSPSSAPEQTTGNAPLSPRLDSGRDKWKAALSQSSSTSSSPAPAAEKPAASPASSNSVPRVGSVSARTFPFAAANSRDSTPTGKPAWARSDSPTSPKSPAVNPATPVSTTENAPSPRTLIRAQGRGPVQSLTNQFHRPSSTSPPPSNAASRAAGNDKEKTPQPKPEKKETISQTQGGKQSRDSYRSPPPPSQQQSSPAPPPAGGGTNVQIDDSDLVGLPAWKRALIIKKRMKQAGITSLPAQQTQPPAENKTPTPTTPTPVASGREETDSGAPLSPSNVTTSKASTTGSSRPNVVNRSDENDSGSNKLVEKEGVTLRPPIFNEVDQWANVATDDPKFTKLPSWKQAMILRRRKDIAKRSGQETSPPESPKVKTAAEKRKGSTSSVSGSNQAKKNVKKSTVKTTSKETAKTSGKVEEKKSTTKAKTNKAEEKKENVKKTKGKTEEDATPKTAKTAKSSGKRIGGSGGSLKPVRAAPTKPPEKKNKEVTVKVEEKEKEKEDNEDPMFTWSFSKHSMETGDAMSASSDSELEDVHVTSIDDMLSDEDDSGIGGSGGTVLMSYKPLAITVEEEEREKEKEIVKETTLKPRERTMSASSSDPEIKQTMTRSESKSILADPAKKSYKGMRRVSFSDSSLHTEHFYPKYDYSDYDEIEQELPDIFGRGKLRNINAGLSHRLHPSLRTDNEPDSDSYRYGFNSSTGSNPSSPSPHSTTALADSPSSVGVGIGGGGGGLSSYKPSMLSSFDSLGSFSSPVHSPPVIASPIKEDISAEANEESEQVDSATDYYSTLNADTAALLW